MEVICIVGFTAYGYAVDHDPITINVGDKFVATKIENDKISYYRIKNNDVMTTLSEEEMTIYFGL